LLQTHPFTEDERASGARLVEAVCRLRVSKYNVQKDEALPLPETDGVLLVVGQVDDDAAIRLGTQSVASNEQLLLKVREENPQAFLLYKPHPDVLSGNRRGALSVEVERLANWIEKDRSVAACLDVATEVHTMTSLVGFEGLLRGLPVKTYGSPFYAGWGLTDDRIPCTRRTRRLGLEELVHGVLSLYPRYYAHEFGCFLTAEEAVTHLEKTRSRDGRGEVSPTLSRKVTRFWRYLSGVLRRG
jgi:capsular polysaccharide export protein